MSDYLSQCVQFMAGHSELTIRFGRCQDIAATTELRMAHRWHPVSIEATLSDAAIDDASCNVLLKTMVDMERKLAEMYPAVERFRADHSLERPPEIRLEPKGETDE